MNVKCEPALWMFLGRTQVGTGFGFEPADGKMGVIRFSSLNIPKKYVRRIFHGGVIERKAQLNPLAIRTIRGTHKNCFLKEVESVQDKGQYILLYNGEFTL